MKLATLFSLLACLIVGTAQGQEGDLNGTWTLKSRTCSSGTPPNDAYDAQHGMMSMTVAGGKALLVIDVGPQKPKWAQVGRIAIQADQLTFTPETNVFNSAGVEITSLAAAFKLNASAEVWTLQASDFGSGGTCPVGDTLTIEFQKK